MENNEQKKTGRQFGFTSLKTTEEKHEILENPEVQKIVEGDKKLLIISPPSVEARRKLMQEHSLRLDTVPIGGDVPFKDAEDFKTVLNAYKREDRYTEGKKMGWSQKKLAAHYILEGIRRDKKKFEIN